MSADLISADFKSKTWVSDRQRQEADKQALEVMTAAGYRDSEHCVPERRNQNTIKSEITNTLGDLTKTLNSVAKSQTASTMDQLDMQMRLAFTQKQSLQGQLATVNQALEKNRNDQLAVARKMQLEDFIKQNESYMQDAQQKMSRIRNNN